MTDHNANMLRLLNRNVLDLMNRIEDRTGKMFHEFDAALDKRTMDVMDSKNKGQLNRLISDLEELLFRIENNLEVSK